MVLLDALRAVPDRNAIGNSSGLGSKILSGYRARNVPIRIGMTRLGAIQRS